MISEPLGTKLLLFDFFEVKGTARQLGGQERIRSRSLRSDGNGPNAVLGLRNRFATFLEYVDVEGDCFSYVGLGLLSRVADTDASRKIRDDGSPIGFALFIDHGVLLH